ncbi:MAG TPA: PaaI family thioesterase [Candidatus Dormibacteraeota bacterium]|nr:PaaI family thioesterase [Candidatus Dormibacteraeota bacterium]
MSIGNDTGVRVWEEPVRGTFGDLSTLRLPGLERMRENSRGDRARPPIHHLTGLTPVESGYGFSTFRMPVTPWLQTTVPGLVTGGVIAFLSDGPLGTAMMTVLPPLAYMTTSDLSLSFLQPATLESGTLVGRARLIHSGRSVALSEVTIEDSLGRHLAHGTSRGFLLTAPGAPPAPSEAPREPDYATPDPYLRSVAGSPVSLDDWSRMTGLEVLRLCIDDRTYAPPIYRLTGLHPTQAEEGTCTFALPASPWLASPSPVLYGGAIALLADTALSCAVMTINPAGSSFAPLDLKVNYLRPVLPDGGLLSARATLVHRGRSMAVATAELSNTEGKVIAIASSSVMLLPGRSWSELAGSADRDVPDPGQP